MEPSQPQASSLSKDPQATTKPPFRQVTWLWLLLTLLLTGGGIGLWRVLAPGQDAPATVAEQSPGVKVKVSPVQTGTIEQSSEYVARLESRRSVNLLPQIQGRISKIMVRLGDQVRAGTPLIQVDPDEQQAAVNSLSAAAQAARAAVANAKAELSSLEAQRLENLSNVEYNQKEYERYSRLADQGAVARSVADRYTNQIKSARASLAAINKRIEAQKAAVVQAEKSLQQAEANVREQKVQLGYYTINAPFAGTVGDIPVKVGDFVNTSTQLTTVTENRPLQVNISVPIELGPQLRKGMLVQLLDGQGRSLGTSRVFFIAPNTATNTQSILVKSLFDNAKGQLRADQYVRARLILNQRLGVLVPTTAVTRLGGETFVYVVQPAPPQPEKSQPGQTQLVARQIPVKLGEIQGNNYQVLEGLKPGEKIVVSGLLNLKDGAPIIPES